MKKSLEVIKSRKVERINSRLNDTEEWISELEEREMEITEAEKKRKKERNEDRLRDL